MPLISKQITRKIETELYAYPTKSKELKDKRENIIHETPFSEVRVSGGEMGNQTQSRGMRLFEANDPWVKLIHDALSIMPGEYRIIIESYYFKHKNMNAISIELKISLSLCYAWKENMLFYLLLMATKRQLIDPVREE